MNEKSSIHELKGIGDKTESLFHKIGVESIGDLLRYFPRRYDVYEKPVPIAELEMGKVYTISGVIQGRVQLAGRPNMQIVSVNVKDDSGILKVVWYRMPFLKNTLSEYQEITLRGSVVQKKGQKVMEHPELFVPVSSYTAKLDSLQPVYPLTSGLSNNLMIKSVKQALDYLDLAQDFLPQNIRMKYHLAEYNYALKGIHFPQRKEELYYARERLVFEEFLIFTLALRQTRIKQEKEVNGYDIFMHPKIAEFLSGLPFELTGAQKKVWEEIRHDICGPYTMSRLVQGDVGSGKTIVAVLALMLVGLNGYQGAMMAPTEVLAKQHYEKINGLMEQYEISLKVELVTGSMTAKEKRLAYEHIENGEVQIIVGTHALIQEKVHYQNLALVITDEQHRFGVRQRETLAQKGKIPHILVMSATPIPRTLAIILYGELDISVIDELPSNRLPIKNCVVDTGYRSKAYQFMKKEISEGRQCYIICPMVEDSEAIEAENVTDYAENLQKEMGTSIRVCALHGKMKQKQKDEIMEQFARNEIQILVSTTVIEVGIDVPNATVMMVENAERFGLAQLHQLRGRVGRGKHQSYCIFMSGSKTKEAKKRLEILNHSNDGFHIANEDMKLRGPGDLFGIRQSGLMDFKIGDVFQDAKILQQANEAAGEILKDDPKLEKKENERLAEQLSRYLNYINLETTL